MRELTIRCGVGALGLLVALVSLASPAVAQSDYTSLDIDDCTIIDQFEGGGYDAVCPGLGDVQVHLSEGDARADVDYGVPNDNFESFGAFNGVGDTVEWYSDADGVSAAILRFLVDADGRSAEALVVSRVGTDAGPGCVIGVVDAGHDQANGVARGIAAMARSFDCASDLAPVLASQGSLAASFSPANR